jgi:hypothetical protein
MKKCLKYFLLIWIIAFSAPPAYVLSYENLSSLRQPIGFSGIYWGSEPYNYTYLFLKSDNVDGIEAFGRECEKLTLGPAKLSEITYHFYQNKFFQVSIILNSDSDHQSLLDALIETYGTPEKESGMYIWGNDTVVIRLFPRGASITYLPILDKINEKYNNN